MVKNAMTAQFLLLCLMAGMLMYLPAWGQTPRQAQPQLNDKDIDLFVVNWQDVKPRTMYGVLEVRDLLTRTTGNPNRPTKKGMVLRDLKQISYGILKPGGVTTPSKLSGEQYIMYIDGGTGVIRAGGQTAELMEGIGVIMPPALEFSIENNGSEFLTMYIIVEPIPKDFSPRPHMVVRNSYDKPISSAGNRGDMEDYLFSYRDGLAVAAGINPVMFEPRTLFPAHAHPQEVEEVWIALSGDMEFVIGSQRRQFPEGSAYRAPADGVTGHINVNLAETSRRLLWIMVVPRESLTGETDSMI
jgi:mannose-6-phosphate isomerase-like protein (cupin superfamily)